MRALSVLLLTLGCGAAGAGPEPGSPPAATTRLDPAPAYEPPVTGGTILRAELTPVLDAGLGRFLQGVVTKPRLEAGDFIGFEIVSLYPDDPRFARLELQPGDVVTRINGQSIERPEHALAVWSSLRVASQLLVEFRHEDEPRELRFEIID